MLAEALLKDYTGSVNDLCETPLATFVNEVKCLLAICRKKKNVGNQCFSFHYNIILIVKLLCDRRFSEYLQ